MKSYGWLLLLFLAGGQYTTRATDYFVSPNGNDKAAGTSAKQPWKTIQRVNQFLQTGAFRAGDSVRFRGGSRFSGSLRLDRPSDVTQGQVREISTYGKGRATLLAGRQTGILIRDTGHVTIANLDIVADANSDGDGIRVDRVHETGSRLSQIVITNCTAIDFGWHGIAVDSSICTNGYQQVRLVDCQTIGNRHVGIMVYGGNPTGRTWHPHADVTIHRCVASNNPGDPEWYEYHSGSGIFVDGVDSAEISECIAFENGSECRAERGGPVGIWAHASRRVTIEHCESYGNQSLLKDGGGFDLDGGCEDSTLRWNYSHDNHGAGFLVYTYSGAAYADRGCRVIGNISINDGQRGTTYAGIQIGSEAGCQIRDLDVSKNTIISPEGSMGGLRISGMAIQATIQSNLVVAPVPGILVALSGYNHHLHFSGNRYWRADGKPVFLVDGQWTVRSLADWRNSTGPETRFTWFDEQFVDPRLNVRLPRPAHSSIPKPQWPQLSHALPSGLGAPATCPAD